MTRQYESIQNQINDAVFFSWLNTIHCWGHLSLPQLNAHTMQRWDHLSLPQLNAHTMQRWDHLSLP